MMADEGEHRGGVTGPASAFLRLAGADGAPIEGPVTRAGQAGWVELQAWSHDLAADSAGTEAAVRHRPIVLVKAVDATTPRLLQALLDGERLSSWRLEVWRPVAPGSGRRWPPTDDLLTQPFDLDRAAEIYAERIARHMPYEELCQAIELTGATVSRIETVHDGAAPQPRERITFTYDAITWTWGDEERSAPRRGPKPRGPAGGGRR